MTDLLAIAEHRAATARPGALRIVAHLANYPETWFSALEFERIADARLSARTALSEARGVIEAQGGKLLNRLTYDNRKVIRSEYAYFPVRSRAAGDQRSA